MFLLVHSGQRHKMQPHLDGEASKEFRLHARTQQSGNKEKIEERKRGSTVIVIGMSHDYWLMSTML